MPRDNNKYTISVYERLVPVRLHNKLHKEALTEFACESADNCVHYAQLLYM